MSFTAPDYVRLWPHARSRIISAGRTRIRPNSAIPIRLLRRSAFLCKTSNKGPDWGLSYLSLVGTSFGIFRCYDLVDVLLCLQKILQFVLSAMPKYVLDRSALVEEGEPQDVPQLQGSAAVWASDLGIPIVPTTDLRCWIVQRACCGLVVGLCGLGTSLVVVYPW